MTTPDSHRRQAGIAIAVIAAALVAITFALGHQRGYDAAEFAYFGTIGPEETVIVKAWREPDTGINAQRWSPREDKELAGIILDSIRGAYDEGKRAAGECGPVITADGFQFTIPPGQVLHIKRLSSEPGVKPRAELRPADGRFDFHPEEFRLGDPATYQWKALTPTTPDTYTIEPPR